MNIMEQPGELGNVRQPGNHSQVGPVNCHGKPVNETNVGVMSQHMLYKVIRPISIEIEMLMVNDIG